MSQDNEPVMEEVIEKEIKLEETPETTSENSCVKELPKFVEKKHVADLSDEEKARVIYFAQNGIEQPFFDVKQLKNGKVRIVRKKEAKQTVAQKVVKEQPPVVNDQKVYYSDNQLLFEHIIELNAKVEKLISKQKKLKKKYQTLQSDLYIDDADEGTEFAGSLALKDNVYSTNLATHVETEQDNVTVKPQPKQYYPQKVKTGWRSQVTFI